MNRNAFCGCISLLALLCSPSFGAISLTTGQLAAAERVFVGTASCEANQQVTLAAVPGQAGHFTLKHKKTTVKLVTQETTSGAVRLEDPKSGLVWIQIPAKSMLMNTKLGRRVADVCITPEQALTSIPPEPAPAAHTPTPMPMPMPMPETSPTIPPPEPAPAVPAPEPAPATPPPEPAPVTTPPEPAPPRPVE